LVNLAENVGDVNEICHLNPTVANENVLNDFNDKESSFSSMTVTEMSDAEINDFDVI